MQAFQSPLLTICGIEELGNHSARGVTHVLSILDPGRPEPESFWTFDPHHRVTLHFDDVIDPGPNLVLPGPEHVDAILDFGRSLVTHLVVDRPHLLVHCHAGISRSTAAMATLLAQANPQASEDELFEHVLRIRPQAWPNSVMIAFADDLLKRRGRLSEALRRLYVHQLKTRPGTEAYMRKYGRGREVDIAQSAA